MTTNNGKHFLIHVFKLAYSVSRNGPVWFRHIQFSFLFLFLLLLIQITAYNIISLPVKIEIKLRMVIVLVVVVVDKIVYNKVREP